MKFPEPLYTVDFAEYRRSHIYPVTLPNGTKLGPFKSVTKIKDIINKPALINWAKKMALECAREELINAIGNGKEINAAVLDEIMALAKGAADAYKDKCGDIGQRTHDAINDWIHGKTPKLTNDTRPGFENFMRWLKSEKMTVVKGDTNLASILHGFGGRSDAYFERAGKLILGDFKTGKALYNDTVVQIGGYDIATLETYGIQVDRGIVLRIGKEIPGDIEPKEVNLPFAREAFMHALGLFKSMELKDKLWLPIEVTA